MFFTPPASLEGMHARLAGQGGAVAARRRGYQGTLSLWFPWHSPCCGDSQPPHWQAWPAHQLHCTDMRCCCIASRFQSGPICHVLAGR
jgi:hypothetical protein